MGYFLAVVTFILMLVVAVFYNPEKSGQPQAKNYSPTTINMTDDYYFEEIIIIEEE